MFAHIKTGEYYGRYSASLALLSANLIIEDANVISAKNKGGVSVISKLSLVRALQPASQEVADLAAARNISSVTRWTFWPRGKDCMEKSAAWER